MADENIGNLSVGVTADLSDVDQALNQFIERATGAGADIADAMKQFMDMAAASVDGFGASATTAGEQLSLFGTTINDIPFADASGQLNLFTTELEQIIPAATGAASGMQEAAQGVHQLTTATQEATVPAQGLVSSLEELGRNLQSLALLAGVSYAIEAFGKNALEAAASLETTTIAMTALTGSATEAASEITALRDIANSDGLRFNAVQDAAQKMTALGFAAHDVFTAIQAAANAAAATGTSFQTVTNSIDRMAESGTLAARQLATLGLSTVDMANAMGLAADTSAKTITAVFKSLDQADRVTLLSTALQKFGDTAEKTAQGMEGQFHQLQNAIQGVFENLGSALAPAAEQILNLLNNDILPFVNSAITAFRELPAPVQDVAIAIGVLAAAIPPLVLSLGTIGIALGGLEGLLPVAAGMLNTVGISVATAGAEAEAGSIGFGSLAAAIGTLAIPVGIAAGAIAVWNIPQFGRDTSQATVSVGDMNRAMTELAQDIENEAVKAFGDLAGKIPGSKSALDDLNTSLGEFGRLIVAANNNTPTFHQALDEIGNAAVAATGPVGALKQVFEQLGTQFQYASTQFRTIGWDASTAGVKAYSKSLQDAIATQDGVDTSLNALKAQQQAYSSSVAQMHAQAAAEELQAAAQSKGIIQQSIAQLQQHMDAELEDTAAGVEGVTVSVKHSAALQENATAVRFNTTAVGDKITALIKDFQETNAATQAAGGNSVAAKQQALALQDAINEVLKHSEASKDGITVTVGHANAMLGGASSAKQQSAGLEEALNSLFRHTAGSKDGVGAVTSHSGALNTDQAAAELQAGSLSKSLTQILLHTDGLGLNATQLKNTVTWLLEHSKDLSAGIPILGGHTTALDANAKAAKDSVDPLIQRVAQLIQNQLNEKNGLATVIAGGKAMDDHAASAKVDAQALADLFIQLDKQRSVVGPIVDLLKIQHDDTVAASVATNAWLGPLGLAVIALDSQTRSLTAAEAPLHVVGNEADTTNTKMVALGSDGIPLVTRNTDLLLRMLPGVPPALDDIAGGMQIVYGHANDTSSAVNTLTKANKDLADQTQQTTQATQIWSSVLHDIPWWEGGTGSTMLTGNELALEFQTTKTTAALNAQSTALSQLASAAQSCGGCFRGVGMPRWAA